MSTSDDELEDLWAPITESNIVGRIELSNKLIEELSAIKSIQPQTTSIKSLKESNLKLRATLQRTSKVLFEKLESRIKSLKDSNFEHLATVDQQNKLIQKLESRVKQLETYIETKVLEVTVD